MAVKSFQIFRYLLKTLNCLKEYSNAKDENEVRILWKPQVWSFTDIITVLECICLDLRNMYSVRYVYFLLRNKSKLYLQEVNFLLNNMLNAFLKEFDFSENVF